MVRRFIIFGPRVPVVGTVFYYILVMRELLPLVNSAYTFYQVLNQNNACKSKLDYIFGIFVIKVMKNDIFS